MTLNNSCACSDPDSTAYIMKALDYRHDFWAAALLNVSFMRTGALSFTAVTPTPSKMITLSKYLLNERMINLRSLLALTSYHFWI